MIFRKNTKILVVLLFGIMSLSPACKTKENIPEDAQEAQNAELLAQKEAEKEYQLAVKRHQDMQSKQTIEGAKRLKKRQLKNNKSRQRSWWDRLFNNKCDKPVDN